MAEPRLLNETFLKMTPPPPCESATPKIAQLLIRCDNLECGQAAMSYYCYRGVDFRFESHSDRQQLFPFFTKSP